MILGFYIVYCIKVLNYRGKEEYICFSLLSLNFFLKKMIIENNCLRERRDWIIYIILESKAGKIGNDRKIIFVRYGGMCKNKCPQLFNCPLLGLFTWTATDLKSECGISPDLGFVWGDFSTNAVSIKIRAVS